MNELLTRFKGIWIPLVIGLFLITFIAIGIRYYQQSSEQSELREDISLVSRIASEATRNLKEWEDRSKLVQEIIPASDLKETDVYAMILNLASETKVQSVKITFKSEGQKNILGTVYRTISFSLTAEGSYNAIQNFLKALDQEPTELEVLVLNPDQAKRATLVIEGVRISAAQITSAAIDFIVYTDTGSG